MANKIYELYNWNSYKVHSCQALHLRKNILKMHLSFDCERFLIFLWLSEIDSVLQVVVWMHICCRVTTLQKYYVRRKRKIGTILYPFIIESIVRQWLTTGIFPLQFSYCHPLLLPSYFLLFQANDFYRQSHDNHMCTNLLEAICLFQPLLKKPLPFSLILASAFIFMRGWI